MDGRETNEEIINKKTLVLRILEVFGELVSLNIIFLICSLPFFTLGASITALYTVVFKIISKKEGSIFTSFITAFKKNFKQATIIWMGVLVYFLVVFSQYYLVIMTPGIIGNIYLVIMFITLVAGLLTITFIFPIIARYENCLKKNIKNSFLLAVSNLWPCIKVFCLWGGTIGISVMYPVVFMYSWYLWIFIAFALIAYLSSRIMIKVFSKVK